MPYNIPNFVGVQGGTWARDSYCENDDGTSASVEGYTGKWEIRPTESSSTVLLSGTTEDGGMVVGGTAENLVGFRITADQMSDLPVGTHFLTSELYNGPTVIPYIRATFEVLREGAA